MQRRTLLAAVAAAAVGLSAAGVWLRAQEPKAEPPAKAEPPRGEFAGKVVFVQARGGVRAATLEGAALRQLGGRAFLVGKAVSDEVLTRREYFTGAQLWVPVEDIESLAVFDSLGQLRRSAGGD
jgi:hypothetical protein